MERVFSTKRSRGLGVLTILIYPMTVARNIGSSQFMRTQSKRNNICNYATSRNWCKLHENTDTNIGFGSVSGRSERTALLSELRFSVDCNFPFRSMKNVCSHYNNHGLNNLVTWAMVCTQRGNLYHSYLIFFYHSFRFWYFRNFTVFLSLFHNLENVFIVVGWEQTNLSLVLNLHFSANRS